MENKKYDWISYFNEGLASVKLSDKWGYINENGEEIIPCKYDLVGNFYNGFSSVKLFDKCGFINEKGEEITPIKYDDVYDFNNGFAPVKLSDKWGFINENGEEIIPIKYDLTGSFNNGFAWVEIGLFEGYINEKGEEIVPCDRFYFVAEQGNNTFYCDGFDYSCIIDKDGKESDIIYKPQLDYDNLSLKDMWVASLSEPEKYVYHLIQDSKSFYGGLYKKGNYINRDYKLRYHFNLTNQEIERIYEKIVVPYIASLK